MLNRINKKILTFAVIILLGALIAVGLIFYKRKGVAPPAPEEKTQEEIIIEKQLKELDELRKESGAKPLTEEEIQQQTEELDALRKEAQIKPLSEEEIKKQMEELDKLRQSQ